MSTIYQKFNFFFNLILLFGQVWCQSLHLLDPCPYRFFFCLKTAALHFIYNFFGQPNLVLLVPGVVPGAACSDPDLHHVQLELN
jgi:hypothetical protein